MSRKGHNWDNGTRTMASKNLRETSDPHIELRKKTGFEGKISKCNETMCFLVYFVPRQLGKRCSYNGNIYTTTRKFPETETFMLITQFF